ncbi:ABC transporter permease [Paenibacillus sp. JX-17]|uniref:ABC transporter permease n=1 Tax=Paenibacillus lacisoli TaxID=3064525 RepID=A0ABT9CDS9_9BACL|nr:ABC transporter permease [Paenibacillus sp. JX-17]MDO7907429.1 ABC transporter permease [Paenibacillus sp. JX-17]
MNNVLKVFTKDSFILPVVAIIMGLILGAIVMLIGGYNPIEAYSALFTRVYGDSYNFGEAIREMTPLVLTGLAFAFAARAGLFNIGGEGQFLVGMTAATVVGVQLHGLPAYIHAPLAVIAGAVFGGLWASIAGYLKAVRGVNEVITCIMLNWIGLYLANLVINRWVLMPGENRSKEIQESASISITWLSEMMGNARLHWGTLIAILAAVFFYIFMWKTKQGYELRSVGFNQDASKYAGMNVNRNVVKAMFISGVFAGLAGAFEVLGVFHYQTVMAGSPGTGFDGIAVSLIGMNNPFGVLLGSVLFGTLTYGSAGMSFEADVPPEIIRIVIGSIIFFIAAQGIVRWVLKPFYAKRKKEKVL